MSSARDEGERFAKQWSFARRACVRLKMARCLDQEGVKALSLAGVGGPHALVLGTESYYPVMQAGRCALGSRLPARPVKVFTHVRADEDRVNLGQLGKLANRPIVSRGGV